MRISLMHVLVSAILHSSLTLVQGQDNCTDLLGGSSVTLVMVADPGDFAGTPEAKYLRENLREAHPITGTVCHERLRGTLLGEPVSLVTSGIGPVTAALCTQELLRCALNIKDFIFMGTAGYSSQVGGLLDPQHCTGPTPALRPTRLGDLTVSPFAVNWECKLADWEQQCKGYPNLCSDPSETYGPSDSVLFGPCRFTTHTTADLSLADELLRAANSSGFAANNAALAGVRNSTVTSYEKSYWAAVANGTNRSIELEAWKQPYVFDYRQSAEVDGQFFYTGTPWDAVARAYVAQTIDAARVAPQNVTASDVVAAAAMEGVGVAEALEKHLGLRGSSPVTHTFIRGASDYITDPVRETAPGVWGYAHPAQAADTAANFGFAVASASELILTFFQQRCWAAHGEGFPQCGYTISYGGNTAVATGHA